jgi:hypothetical protein
MSPDNCVGHGTTDAPIAQQQVNGHDSIFVLGRNLNKKIIVLYATGADMPSGKYPTVGAILGRRDRSLG